VTSPPIAAAVFDLGGVLIDWDPRHLYRTLFDDESEMEAFLATVTTPEWNLAQDAGRSWAEAIDELVARHPEQRERIEAYWLRWPETLGGTIETTVAVLDELRLDPGLRLFALSNWSAETFSIARPRFPFLDWFDGIVISGEEGIVKPDPRIFTVVAERFGLEPSTTVFVDDQPRNVDAAAALGFRAIRFVDADDLRARLAGLGLLSRPEVPVGDD
jgi:2-haloacid dehalogenase